MSLLRKYWDSIASDIERSYKQGHPSNWKKRQINLFLDQYLKKKVVRLCKADMKKSQKCNVLFLQGRYDYANWEPLSYDTFRRIFVTKKSNGKNATQHIFAIYFDYDSYENYVHANQLEEERPLLTPSLQIDSIDTIKTKLQQVYLKNPLFTQIPLLGNSYDSLPQLSMEDYFVEVSYLSITSLQNKETLLLKEKENYERKESIRRSFANEAYLNESLINDHEKILILGNPGIGKTIYARWLCYSWANNTLSSNRIPIYFQLREINFENSDKHISFLDTLNTFYQLNFTSQTFKNFVQDKNGHVLFILDGFDELSHNKQIQLLNTLKQTAIGDNFMLLSRPYAILNHQIHISTVIEIIGFGKLGKNQYLYKIFNQDKKRSSMQKNAEELLDIIHASPLLKELSSTPLFLSYITLIYLLSEQRTLNTTKNISSIFQLQDLVLECIANRFVQKAKNEYENPIDVFHQITLKAEQLAAQMETQQVFVIAANNKDIHKIGGLKLLNKINHIGLGRLDNYHPLNPSFQFLTVPLQEYLAACHIGDTLSPQKFLKYLSNRFSWNFCRMIVGRAVQKNLSTFISQVWIQLDWSNKNLAPNVYYIYYQLLFLSELNKNYIHQYITIDILDTFLNQYTLLAAKSPAWRNILLDPLSKLVNKLNPPIYNHFLQKFIEKVTTVIQSIKPGTIYEETGFVITNWAIFANRLQFCNEPTLLNRAIEWLVHINNTQEQIYQHLSQQEDSTSELHGYYTESLINIALDISSIFEETDPSIIKYVENKITTLIDDVNLRFEIQEPFIPILLKFETWEYIYQQLGIFYNRLENAEELDSFDNITFLLERAGNVIKTTQDELAKQELVYFLKKLYLRFLEIIDEEEELEEWFAIVVADSYKYALACTEHQDAYELLFQITTFFPSIATHVIPNTPLLNNILTQQLAAIKIQSNRKITLDDIYNFTQLLIFIQSFDKCFFFFSKNRDDIFNYIELIFQQYGDYIHNAYRLNDKEEEIIEEETYEEEIIEEETYEEEIIEEETYEEEIIKEETYEEEIIEEETYEEEMTNKGTETIDEIDYYLNILTRVLANEYFIDKRFLLNKIFSNQKIYHNNFIRYALLFELLHNDIGLYKKEYWDYFYHLIEVEYDPFHIIRLISNIEIYYFPSNIKNLLPIWEYLSHIMSEEKMDKIPLNFFPIFSCISNLLRLLILETESIDRLTQQKSLYAISSLMNQERFKHYLIDFDNNKIDTVSIGIIAYLLIYYFDPSVKNNHIQSIWQQQDIDLETINAFMTYVFTENQITYLKGYIPDEMYQQIQFYYTYFGEPKQFTNPDSL